MPLNRRRFLNSVILTAAGTSLVNFNRKSEEKQSIIKPKRLKEGDTVGLVCPAGAAFSRETVQVTRESLEALGLKIKEGKHMYDRHGYLAGTDEARAADINAMFADNAIKAIVAVHGGWGCSRILPLLDYKLIQTHPKIILGYSDITALLLGIYAKTGLITFHGPVGASTWNAFSVAHLKNILFEGMPALLQNPNVVGDNLTQVEDRISTITPGKARGKLMGGNLTVLTTIIGSEYLPDFTKSILFLEDVDEQIYRVDRMFTQLKLARHLTNLSGFVFGKCTNCNPGSGFGSLTMEDLMQEHVAPLTIPSFRGAMIGHIDSKFTIPIGVEAEMDASKGTIQLLEPAVV